MPSLGGVPRTKAHGFLVLTRARACALAVVCLWLATGVFAQPDARRAEPVVTFTGGQISVGQLEDDVLSRTPFMQERYLEPASIRSVLDERLRVELLAAEAERRGYATREPVRLAVKQNAVQALIAQEFDAKITPQSLSAEAVQKYYDAHVDEFNKPEMRRASALIVATEQDAKALLAEAKAADLRTFRELVRTKSSDPTNRLRGGDLRYFDVTGRLHEDLGHEASGNAVAKGSAHAETAPNVDETLAKAVFELKNIGDTSAVLHIGESFAIARLTGLRPAETATPAQADERIRMRLWREQRQAAIDAHIAALKQEAKPEVHPELIDLVRFDAAPTPPTQGLPPGFPHTQAGPLPEPPAQ